MKAKDKYGKKKIECFNCLKKFPAEDWRGAWCPECPHHWSVEGVEHFIKPIIEKNVERLKKDLLVVLMDECGFYKKFCGKVVKEETTCYGNELLEMIPQCLAEK